jgi:threonine synthase
MDWISSRGASPPIKFIDALFAGTAPDGGLYMPERIDPLPAEALRRVQGADIVTVATVVGGHLLRGEITEAALEPLVRDALDFPVPLVPVTDRVWALELFHGPTLAFKDVGARVQARLLHLYPAGKVTDVQEAQMASMGDNILAVAVDGTFDDCQRLVKTAFADDELRKHVWLTPANSINLGRLLPQVFYYFLVSAVGGEEGPVVAVPSGNFGDLTAGLIAKRLGLRVRHFVAATNVNDAVPRYLRSGVYDPKDSVHTVANAMDVGAPSNFERMQWIYGGDIEALRRDVRGFAYEDGRVVAEIGRVYREHGYLLDPHGAIGWLAVNDALRSADEEATGVFLATAHPAKFREVVEPAIGQAVPLPPVLADAITRPRHAMNLSAEYADLRVLLRS